ncbi:hypothetical protein [Portibacter marinus]|uniref:hypothetical protein n=1 Tax=Portibacter marinus TaxID=2898660 RepID=UPI001F265496|nr:hypothetical protein [Portibacter marinus]
MINKGLLISFFAIIFLVNIDGQIHFETSLDINIGWDDRIYHEYYSKIENENESVNSATLVKLDNIQLQDYENVILNFIVNKLIDGTLIAQKGKGGDTLSQTLVHKTLYWKCYYNPDHFDTIRRIDFDSMINIQIHQEWHVDTSTFTIQNKINGLSVFTPSDTSAKNEVYIPFNNNFNSINLNDPSIAYARALNTRHSWEEFPKELVSKIISYRNGKRSKINFSNNPLNNISIQVSNLDSLLTEMDLPIMELSETISQYSQGLGISQYLYLDLKTKTINTTLNAIAPLFAQTNYEGVFMFYGALFWYLMH